MRKGIYGRRKKGGYVGKGGHVEWIVCKGMGKTGQSETGWASLPCRLLNWGERVDRSKEK